MAGSLQNEGTDRLIAELEYRGYYAVKKETVKDLHASRRFFDDEIAQFGSDTRFIEALHRDLGMDIGVKLVRDGVVHVSCFRPVMSPHMIQEKIATLHVLTEKPRVVTQVRDLRRAPDPRDYTEPYESSRQ